MSLERHYKFLRELARASYKVSNVLSGQKIEPRSIFEVSIESEMVSALRQRASYSSKLFLQATSSDVFLSSFDGTLKFLYDTIKFFEDGNVTDSVNTQKLIHYNLSKTEIGIDLTGISFEEACSAAYSALAILLNKYNFHLPKSSFKKQIQFPPHLKQAGISALSYFNRILESKYPDQDIQVSIQQSPNADTVTLTITTPDGEHLESIEKTLTTYGQVITGNAQIAALTNDRTLQTQLATKIELLTVELNAEKRINDLLKDDVDSLRKQLGVALEGNKELQQTLCAALANRSPETSKSLKIIDSLVTAALGGELDQDRLKDELEKVKSNDPSTYQDIIDVVKGASGSGLGKVLGEMLLEL